MQQRRNQTGTVDRVVDGKLRPLIVAPSKTDSETVFTLVGLVILDQADVERAALGDVVIETKDRIPARLLVDALAGPIVGSSRSLGVGRREEAKQLLAVCVDAAARHDIVGELLAVVERVEDFNQCAVQVDRLREISLPLQFGGNRKGVS